MQLVIRDAVVIATHTNEQDVRGLYPGCEVVLYDGQLPRREPLDPLPADPRTPEQKAAAYRDRRRQAYPTVGDQLDMLYWDRVNGTTIWRDTITAVKAQYPKPDLEG